MKNKQAIKMVIEPIQRTHNDWRQEYCFRSGTIFVCIHCSYQDDTGDDYWDNGHSCNGRPKKNQASLVMPDSYDAPF